jgi:hypothetical protein
MPNEHSQLRTQDSELKTQNCSCVPCDPGEPTLNAQADRRSLSSSVADAALAGLAYAALTIVLTWPLVRGLGRDLPAGFGDPLLNAWILGWDADHLLQALSGHVGALADYWNANIFYPHPLALAYSEHLTAQALQILPVYALTHNLLLCYNLVFLASFVLSGLGMFLLARELTGSRLAAFVAGLAFAFAPYRFTAIPHLQVLSSCWMPFVLFGFRRYFTTRRHAPLAGAAAAWILQNLSCGYYLLFFAPILAVYVAWELTVRRLWKDAGALGSIAAATAVVVLASIPFAIPYYELRQLGFAPRSLVETDHFSADVYGLLTADVNLWLWGSLARAFPKPEGALFPGLAVSLLAGYAIVVLWRSARHSGADRAPMGSRALSIALVASSGILLALLFGWTLRTSIGPVRIAVTDFVRVLLVTTALTAALLATSRRARRTAASCLSAPVGILTILLVFSVFMSFGPHIDSRGRTIATENIYSLFYAYVPGYDGLRVPARFGMISALLLACIAAYGCSAAERLRRGRTLVVAAGVLTVIEAVALPLSLNDNSVDYKQADLVPLPPFVTMGDRVPEIYRAVASLPSSSAILELPFGEVAFEVRYEFYSTNHWRRLLNGYSGGSPIEYGLLVETLKDALVRPEPAWESLSHSGATHALVHEASFEGNHGRRLSDWLRSHGASEVAAYDGRVAGERQEKRSCSGASSLCDRLFVLPADRASLLNVPSSESGWHSGIAGGTPTARSATTSSSVSWSFSASTAFLPTWASGFGGPGLR